MYSTSTGLYLGYESLFKSAIETFPPDHSLCNLVVYVAHIPSHKPYSYSINAFHYFRSYCNNCVLLTILFPPQVSVKTLQKHIHIQYIYIITFYNVINLIDMLKSNFTQSNRW